MIIGDGEGLKQRARSVVGIGVDDSFPCGQAKGVGDAQRVMVEERHQVHCGQSSNGFEGRQA